LRDHQIRLVEQEATALEALDAAEEASSIGQGLQQPNVETSTSVFLEQQLAGLLEDPSLEGPTLEDPFLWRILAQILLQQLRTKVSFWFPSVLFIAVS